MRSAITQSQAATCSSHHSRRGAVIVVVVLIMIMSGLAVMTVVAGVSHGQFVVVDRLDTTRAFYAAEAGAGIALREMAIGIDEDGDGVIGGVSSDGNPANDPRIGTANVTVDVAIQGPQSIISSRGRAGDCRRAIEATIEFN